MIMNKILFRLLVLVLFITTSCNPESGKDEEDYPTDDSPPSFLIGKWVRQAPMGPISMNFKKNGLVETDFGNDNTVNIVAKYAVNGDQISFVDQKGNMCSSQGTYKIVRGEYFLAFDLEADRCAGRIKSIMAFWVRPKFSDTIEKISESIFEDPVNSELYLERARVFMALGRSENAKPDLDVYLQANPEDARAWLHRAAVVFPGDPESTLADCTRSLELDPKNKNTWFMKGLALYDLGKFDEACQAFETAIDLGFSVLREAEWDKCSQFWETN